MVEAGPGERDQAGRESGGPQQVGAALRIGHELIRISGGGGRDLRKIERAASHPCRVSAGEAIT